MYSVGNEKILQAFAILDKFLPREMLEEGAEIATRLELLQSDLQNSEPDSKVESVLRINDVFNKEVAPFFARLADLMQFSLNDSIKEDEKKGKFNKITSRLKIKSIDHFKNKLLETLERDITCGIEIIANRICRAEELRCNPVDLTSEYIAQKADEMMFKLIAEEENSKKSIRQPHKKRNKKNIKLEKHQIIEKKEIIKKNEIINRDPIFNDNDTFSNFALTLMKKNFSLPEYKRVHRWISEDPEVIRQFVDIDMDGLKIFRYQNLTDEQIFEQRAKHYLPGTERLLKDSSYRTIYAFPTDLGFGLVVQLTFNQLPRNGILYIGINDRQHVFHKYFEEVNFTTSNSNIFQDKEKINLEKNEAAEEWSSNYKYTLDISETGVLKFTYSDHDIRIFPIRQDLLKKKFLHII